MKRKTRKRIALGLAIGLLVGASSAGIYGAYRAMAESNPEISPLTMTIERRDFPLMIQANGELQSAGAVAIAVPPVPVDKLKIAFTTAQRAIERLERAKIVKRMGDAKRDRVYCASALLDILEEPARLKPADNK